MMDFMLQFCTAQVLAIVIAIMSLPMMEYNPFEAIQEDCFLDVYAYFNSQQAVCALALTSKAMLQKIQRVWTKPGVLCPLHVLGILFGKGTGGHSTRGASMVAMCSSKHCRVLACRDCFKKCVRSGCTRYTYKLCLG